MTTTFVTWDRHVPSGGNTYNRELIAALREAGEEVVLSEVPGGWPAPVAGERAAFGDVLLESDVSLVDGIVACAAPDEVARATAAGRSVVVLVHMPLAEERGLTPDVRDEREASERAALHAATAVVATSRTAAADLERRHGLESVAVALPGAPTAPLARGSLEEGEAPHFLALGAVTPTKDQLTIVEALRQVAHLPWTATLAGPQDDDYAARVRSAVLAAGLEERVRMPGPLVGDPLEKEWAATDLLLLASPTETFGLVVTEALAHGVPALVGAGTGAEEALAGGTRTVAGGGATTRAHGTRSPDDASTQLPGTAFPPGDPDALAAVLHRWLSDAGIREAWRSAAVHARAHQRTWSETAADVLVVLRSLKA